MQDHPSEKRNHVHLLNNNSKRYYLWMWQHRDAAANVTSQCTYTAVSFTSLHLYKQHRLLALWILLKKVATPHVFIYTSIEAILTESHPRIIPFIVDNHLGEAISTIAITDDHYLPWCGERWVALRLKTSWLKNQSLLVSCGALLTLNSPRLKTDISFPARSKKSSSLDKSILVLL